ncbi:MAG: hypothetical protein N4A44_04515 [Alphaproteobacteria bacterium]|jgi:hypothetical protein|nr:hypothetical protein [Alphaproteobacteria bacterium]
MVKVLDNKFAIEDYIEGVKFRNYDHGVLEDFVIDDIKELVLKFSERDPVVRMYRGVTANVVWFWIRGNKYLLT